MTNPWLRAKRKCEELKKEREEKEKERLEALQREANMTDDEIKLRFWQNDFEEDEIYKKIIKIDENDENDHYYFDLEGEAAERERGFSHEKHIGDEMLTEMMKLKQRCPPYVLWYYYYHDKDKIDPYDSFLTRKLENLEKSEILPFTSSLHPKTKTKLPLECIEY